MEHNWSVPLSLGCGPTEWGAGRGGATGLPGGTTQDLTICNYAKGGCGMMDRDCCYSNVLTLATLLCWLCSCEEVVRKCELLLLIGEGKPLKLILWIQTASSTVLKSLSTHAEIHT